MISGCEVAVDPLSKENTRLVRGNKPGIAWVESWQKAALPTKIMQENKKMAFDFTFTLCLYVNLQHKIVRAMLNKILAIG